MSDDYIEYESETPLCQRLTLPTPTAAAVEAGIFGICVNGTYRPDSNEIRTVVEAQIDGLIALTIEIEGYTRAEQTGCHPVSGRWSRSTLRQESNRQLARHYAHSARTNYLGHLNAYERAFGHEASRQLHDFVIAVADSMIGPRDPIEQQLDLF